MKGLILGYKSNGVQIMDKEGYFHFIPGFTDYPLGAEIEVADKLEKEADWVKALLSRLVLPSFPVFQRRPAFSPRMAMSALAVACICAICFFAGRWSQVAYYVEFDGVADIELAFNSMNRVVSVKGVNSEGAELLEYERLIGQSREVIGTTLLAVEQSGAHVAVMKDDSAPEPGYTQFIEVTIIAKNADRAMAICMELSPYLLNTDSNIVIDAVYCDMAKRDVAMALGVSVGKLLLAEHLYDMKPELSLEEIASMPVGEIFEDLRTGMEGGYPF